MRPRHRLLQCIELGVGVVGRDCVRFGWAEAGRGGGGVCLLGCDDLDPLLGRRHDLRSDGLGQRGVLGDAGLEACEQPGEQDGADEGGSE